MYEAKHEPLIPRGRFLRRIAWHFALVAMFLAGSLLAGMTGYRYYEGLTWLDAFLNAAMLLGGMGPVESPQTPGGKFFAGCYALYAGLFVLAVAAIIVAPVLHRVIHRFHWDERR